MLILTFTAVCITIISKAVISYLYAHTANVTNLAELNDLA
jgi:hypothetical protein